MNHVFSGNVIVLVKKKNPVLLQAENVAFANSKPRMFGGPWSKK